MLSAMSRLSRLDSKRCTRTLLMIWYMLTASCCNALHCMMHAQSNLHRVLISINDEFWVLYLGSAN